jgi:hypothetical protein
MPLGVLLRTYVRCDPPGAVLAVLYTPADRDANG